MRNDHFKIFLFTFRVEFDCFGCDFADLGLIRVDLVVILLVSVIFVILVDLVVIWGRFSGDLVLIW